jgi:long-chain acyl-CoA synthetase
MKNLKNHYKKLKDINFKSIFELRVKYDPNNILYLYGDEGKEIKKSVSDFYYDVLKLGTYLSKIYNNKKIALIGENSYNWIISYFASIFSDNIIVPLDKDLPFSDLSDLLKRGECELLIYSKSYEDIANKLNNELKINILSMDEIDNILLNNYKKYYEYKRGIDDLCAIIFTSGTTGLPKAVMLSERNICYDSYYASLSLWLMGYSVLTLPLHHTFALSVNIIGAYICGCPVYISKGIRYFTKELKYYNAKSLALVPLYLETIYKNIWLTAKKNNSLDKLTNAIKLSDRLRKIGIDLRKIFFKKITSNIGKNLENIICGGAFLDQKYIDFFDSIGIKVFNGYGITECSPIVSVNRYKKRIKNSVGMPISCLDVKIIDGEICVKGDSVMLGYYKDEKSTSDVIKNDYFHTGDIGYKDKNGFVFVTGRVKNLIILSNGKNISAEELEKKIYEIDGVEEVVVKGENDIIVAEVYIDGNKKIDKEIDLLNHQMPPYKRISKIIYRDFEFEKTTTRKIKR